VHKILNMLLLTDKRIMLIEHMYKGSYQGWIRTQVPLGRYCRNTIGDLVFSVINVQLRILRAVPRCFLEEVIQCGGELHHLYEKHMDPNQY
jgi:hypothetical protein